MDLLAVGGDVDEARNGAWERGHVAVVLLEVELGAAEGRVDGVVGGGGRVRERRADEILHGAVVLGARGPRARARGRAHGRGRRRVRDLALAADDFAAAEDGGDVVGEVGVEAAAHTDVLVEPAHAADELDGRVQVAEKQAGAREKQVAHAGQLEAEGQAGALVDLHVHVDEEGQQQHLEGAVDGAPDGVRAVHQLGPLVLGLVGAQRQAVAEQVADPPDAAGMVVGGNQAHKPGADVADGTPAQHAEDL